MNIKKSIHAIMVSMIGFSLCASAQTKGPSKQTGPQLEAQRQRSERSYYRKALGVDSLKAEQVARVQGEYKKNLNAVMADTALNDAARRARIKGLMEVKNQRFKALLSPAQQARVIPSTERERPGKQP